jgi:hypothetical protein
MAVATLGFVSSASAADVTITNVGVDTWNNVVTIAGHNNEYATAIFFTDSLLNDFTVFCVDLEHNINVGGGQSLPFDYAELEYDGAGNWLSESISNRIGRLADLGQYYAATLTPSYQRSVKLSAVQGAIWALEYNTTVHSTDLLVDDQIQYLVASITDNGRGRATILQSLDGHQSQTIGGVPEPASWALMITGFGLAGALFRRRRAAVA